MYRLSDLTGSRRSWLSSEDHIIMHTTEKQQTIAKPVVLTTDRSLPLTKPIAPAHILSARTLDVNRMERSSCSNTGVVVMDYDGSMSSMFESSTRW